MQAGHGVFYIFNEASQTYEPFGSYGYAERKSLSHVFRAGQGVVGQCAREGKIIILTQAPSDYVPFVPDWRRPPP
ncbi:MAG: GAF domain-containing protein [Magnetococcus sp. YQC-5]